jgi:hypothetical protein
MCCVALQKYVVAGDCVPFQPHSLCLREARPQPLHHVTSLCAQRLAPSHIITPETRA